VQRAELPCLIGLGHSHERRLPSSVLAEVMQQNASGFKFAEGVDRGRWAGVNSQQSFMPRGGISPLRGSRPCSYGKRTAAIGALRRRWTRRPRSAALSLGTGAFPSCPSLDLRADDFGRLSQVVSPIRVERR